MMDVLADYIRTSVIEVIHSLQWLQDSSRYKMSLSTDLRTKIIAALADHQYTLKLIQLNPFNNILKEALNNNIN